MVVGAKVRQTRKLEAQHGRTWAWAPSTPPKSGREPAAFLLGMAMGPHSTFPNGEFTY